MKRSPLPARTAPLKRSGRPKPRRATPRRVSVDRDPGYLTWLRDRACVACIGVALPGAGKHLTRFVIENALFGDGSRAFRSEAAHTVNNGRSSKGPDSSCIPLCRAHHDEMDGRAGTQITTKGAFAQKYGIDLAQQGAANYALYLMDKKNRA